MSIKFLSIVVWGFCLMGFQKPPYLLPVWRVEGGTACYEECTSFSMNYDEIVHQKCCFIRKPDSVFVFQKKDIALAVDTLASFESMEAYFDKNLPTIDFQLEHNFWLKAIVDADGKIHHWGYYSSRNKAGKAYLIALNKAILKMPRWKPALKQGKKVNSLVTFSVRFTIK